jgi:hypothetical protein
MRPELVIQPQKQPVLKKNFAPPIMSNQRPWPIGNPRRRTLTPIVASVRD